MLPWNKYHSQDALYGTFFGAATKVCNHAQYSRMCQILIYQLSFQDRSNGDILVYAYGSQKLILQEDSENWQL